jgi:hypothetical protein
MDRTLTALFDEPAAADAARDALQALGAGRVELHRLAEPDAVPATPQAPGSEGGLPRLLDALFLPAEDLAAHREAVRRGGTLLSATVEEALAARALRLLEEAGAADLDAREADWRASGWSPARKATEMRADDRRAVGRREARPGPARSYLAAKPAGWPEDDKG